MDLNDTRVVSVKVRSSRVSRVDHECLISSILNLVIYYMHLYLGVTGRNTSDGGSTNVIEGVEGIYML